MALHRVWIATASDGLVRGDQVIGIGSHETPRIPGKTPHWLLVVNLAVTAGSGDRAGWDVGILDRTLCQTAAPPVDASAELAGLLARLDDASAAGIVTALVQPPAAGDGRRARVRFGFTPFIAVDTAAAVDAAQSVTGPEEYL
jgi:hypothetical protein